MNLKCWWKGHEFVDREMINPTAIYIVPTRCMGGDRWGDREMPGAKPILSSINSYGLKSKCQRCGKYYRTDERIDLPTTQPDLEKIPSVFNRV